MRGEKAGELRPVGGEGWASLLEVIRGEKCAECPGTKVEEEPALAGHYGYWITISFQGFVHSWLVGLGGRRIRWHGFENYRLVKDATAARGDAGMETIERDWQMRNRAVRILVMN